LNILSIIITLLIFSLLVVVHEWGHFIVARRNGILVEEFAVGMGPLIYGKTKGDTLYSIRLFPLGGYCKMLGETGEEESSDERSFTSKTVIQRIAVCLAGVIMNFILAVLLATISAGFTGFNTPLIVDVPEGYPAYEAGLQAGDKILKVDNQNIYTYEYLAYFQSINGGKTVEIKYQRDGKNYNTTLTPVLDTDQNGFSSYKYGVKMGGRTGLFEDAREGIEKAGILETFSVGFYRAGFYIKIVIDSLKEMLSFNVKLEELAGPIGIGQVVNNSIEQSAEYGIRNTVFMLMDLATLLSANLAVLNLLPIPALDGGRILFLIIEGIRKKPMDPDKEGFVHLIGFAIVIILAILVAYNDIVRLVSGS
jgi:regulator of sigma E protease